MNMYEIRKQLAESLSKPGIFNAYKSGVDILKKMGRSDVAEDLIAPEQVYVLDEKRLARVSATYVLLPHILSVGTLMVLADAMKTVSEETRREESVDLNIDWNKVFFEKE